MPCTNYVRALAFQPDGQVLASGDYSGLVRLWDTATGREIGRPLAQGEIVLSLTYSPDGKILAVGLAEDNTGKPGVRLWDTVTRKPIGVLMSSHRSVNRIEFRPDGRALLAESNEPAMRLYDVTRGQAIGEPMLDEGTGEFSPDSRTFVTASGEGTVKLRDAATGALIATLMTASSPATCAAFRADGKLVVAGFDDGTVRLCDLATKERLGPPRSMRHAVNQVAFTTDGRSVAAIDELSESRTWPVAEPLDDPNLDDLTLRIEARTGLHMETGSTISRLSFSAWRDRLEQLARLDPSALKSGDDSALHEPKVREAELNGNTFAALWHLDRLIAARPDDWNLYARRARAWSTSGEFEMASSDFQKADQLSSQEQVLEFQTQCVIDCTDRARFTEALWYLDRLIAARPDDVGLREERAAVYGKLGREADRQADLARAFELGADEGLVIPRAEELGRIGRWADASHLLARCGRKGPLSRQLAQAWAIACLMAGDRPGYREVCEAFMASQGPDPTVIWNALSGASLYTIASGGLENRWIPTQWFESRLSAIPAPGPDYCHFFSNALGGLLLRSGRIDEAITRLNDGIAAARHTKDGEFPGDWAYLALDHARKGNTAEARGWLGRLSAFHLDPSRYFWDFHELSRLQSEAEAILFDAEFPRNPFESMPPN
jgi:tetratricopeptide (TPR) repeat protein